MTEATTPKAGKPIWPKIPAGFVRAVLAGHSALGLAFAALIYLVCFSGTTAVFAREFQRWEHPQGPMLRTAAPETIQRAATEAVNRAPGPVEHVFIMPPTQELPRLTVITDGEGGERTWMADAQGRVVGPGAAAWTEFMTALHINLHLPRTWGVFVVGMTGVALLSSLISGLFAHPRVFRDAFHLRWGGSKRLQEADLHNRLGVWALPFHIIVSLTGALLGLTTIIVGVLALAVFQGDVNKAYDLFIPPHPADDPRPAPMPDIAAALRETQRLSPGSTPTFIGLEHPLERGHGVLINASQPNRLHAADAFTFDGQGKPLHVDLVQESTLGEKILGSLGSLHFGWFGGGLIRIAYGLLGTALTIVTASGVAIWLARRRDKGRPAPRWERVWVAAVWSQPFAFAASALAGIAWPGATTPAILAIWGGAVLLSLAATLRLSPRGLSLGLRGAAAVALVLTVGAHLIRFGWPVDPMAVVVNGVLLLLALVLAATVRRSRPPITA